MPVCCKCVYCTLITKIDTILYQNCVYELIKQLVEWPKYVYCFTEPRVAKDFPMDYLYRVKQIHSEGGHGSQG